MLRLLSKRPRASATLRKNPTDDFIRLGEQLSAEKNAAFDLWTWLPSYKAAQAAFGDYASEHMPLVAEVMGEAAMYLGHGMLPTREQIEEAGEIYQCADSGQICAASPQTTGSVTIWIQSATH